MGGNPCGCTLLGCILAVSSTRTCAVRGPCLVFHSFGPNDAVASSSAPQELFSERHYADLDGGILEGFGRLLKFDLKIFVYPTINEKTGEMENVDSVKVAPSVQLLFDYIRQRGTLVPITNYNKCAFRIRIQRQSRFEGSCVRLHPPARQPCPHHQLQQVRSPQSHLRESVMCGEGPCVKVFFDKVWSPSR